MRNFCLKLLIFISILSFHPSLYAQDRVGDETLGSFTSFEAGPKYLLGGGRSVVNDPFMLYFNIGITMHSFFRKSWDSDNITLGPRIGLGFGKSRLPGSGRDLFYDLIANFRYTVGDVENMFRPYVEFGPGVTNYTGAATHVDVGTGLDIFFDNNNTIGLTAHYNEYFGTDIERSITLLGTLSHHW